ncbi:MAG: hypothetical protein H6508_01265 [Calditrichaeota bacterium]|nr:hypothetical protein [Calditrichota bacterium]
MTRGFVKLPRSFFMCPLWAEPRRFNQIDAYLDLLQRAAFHNTSLPLASGHVDLRAGQLFISCRKLAELWGWQGREVRDFLEYLRDLRIAKLEDMQSGIRVSLSDPVEDPSKTLLVNSSSYEDSSENSSQEKEEPKTSKNPPRRAIPDSPGMKEYKALYAEFPGVLESVEFIEFKERKRMHEGRPLEYGPKKLRDLILEFHEAKGAEACGESATPLPVASVPDDLHQNNSEPKLKETATLE